MEDLTHFNLILGGWLGVLQAPLFECLSFDPFSFQ